MTFTFLAIIITIIIIASSRFKRSMTAAVQSILVMSIPEGAWHK